MSSLNKKRNPFEDPEAGNEMGGSSFLLKVGVHGQYHYPAPPPVIECGNFSIESQPPMFLAHQEREGSTLLHGWRDNVSFFGHSKLQQLMMRRTTIDEEEVQAPLWKQRLNAQWSKAMRLYRTVQSSNFVGVITDVLDVVLYFFDVFTDIEVVKVLHANHHQRLMILTIVFITGHYVVMAALVSKYLHRTWGRRMSWLGEDSAAHGLWWLLATPLVVPLIPILDCFMVVTSLLALVAPKAYIMGSFLSNFNFSRVFIEFIMEAIPQSALQAYMVLYFDKNSSREEKWAVAVSLGVSVLAVAQHSWRLRVAAQAAGMSLLEYFKYLLLLKGNFVVPRAVMDIQIKETCRIAGPLLTINGLHLQKNKSRLGPAQQAHILVTTFQRLEDQGLGDSVTKLLLGGCPLNAINGILVQALKSLPKLEVVEVNECAFRGETFKGVKEALRKHKAVHSVRLCQTGMLKKYRNNRRAEVVQLFSRRLKLRSLVVVLPWWDTPKMEKACKKLVTHRHLEALTIEFPAARVAADASSSVLNAEDAGQELDTRYGGSVSVILQVNTTLTSLSLVNHNFGEESVQLIAKALGLNSALTSLSLRGSCIGDRGAIALARALKANTRLTGLNLRRCRVHGEGVTAIAAALVDNTSLRSLDISHNRVLSDGLDAVAQALRHNSTLESLKLEGWRDSFEDPSCASQLSAGLAVNRHLRTLSLADCGVGDSGAIALASALAPATALTSLDLSCPISLSRASRIADAGVLAISSGLIRSRSLESLLLRGAVVGVPGARALGEALAAAGSLRVLDLTNCEIGDEQLGLIAGGVGRSRGVETVRLGQMVEVGMGGMRALAGAVRESRSLLVLDLSYSRLVGDEEEINAQLSVLAGALRANSSLTSLNLAYVNRITESGAAALAAVLTQNCTLKHLDMEGYSSEAASKVFEAVLRENSCLESLPTTNSIYSTLDIIKAKNESEAARSFSGSLL